MKKNLWKKAMALIAAAAVLATSAPNVYATEVTDTESAAETENTENTESTEEKAAETEAAAETEKASSEGKKEEAAAADAGENNDDVVISDSDKPYLSLGADLSSKQLAIVLNLMGIDEDKLDDYNVTYVTNEEEHKYLDDYVSSKKIGTHALSSVVITEAEKGSGLSISTYNINYCTVGMYKNALSTAGITDANIIVAGPSSISGTAALVGAMKAYTEMTGKEISDDVADAALDELVTTGELEQALGDDISDEDIEAFMAELKKELANGALTDEDSMREAIDKLSGEYGVTLSEDEIQQIISLLTKLKGLDLDWDVVADQAQYWLEHLGKAANNITAEDVNSFMGTLTNLLNKLLDFFRSFGG